MSTLSSYGIAIDARHVCVTYENSAGNVNSGLGGVAELRSNGSILWGAAGYSSDIVFPTAVAVGASGNICFANYGDGARFSSQGPLPPPSAAKATPAV